MNRSAARSNSPAQHRVPSARSAVPTLGLAALLAASLLVAGCNVGRWMSTPFWPEYETYDVKAQYRDLEGKSVAVMVSADSHMLFRYPKAPLDVCRAMTERLADNMTTVSLTNPRKVIDYQNRNAYWHLVPYGELLDGLGVQRIVLVELVEYETNKPGNAHEWQGLVTGTISVLAADAAVPDDPVFRTTVRAEFPEGGKVGVINSDEASIRLGMHSIFSRDAAGLFYDHEVTKPRSTVVK